MKSFYLVISFLIIYISTSAQYKNDVTFSGGFGFFLCPTYTNADAGDIAFIEAKER